MKNITYSEAILEGFKYLLDNYPEVFVLVKDCGVPGMLEIL